MSGTESSEDQPRLHHNLLARNILSPFIRRGVGKLPGEIKANLTAIEAWLESEGGLDPRTCFDPQGKRPVLFSTAATAAHPEIIKAIADHDKVKRYARDLLARAITHFHEQGKPELANNLANVLAALESHATPTAAASASAGAEPAESSLSDDEELLRLLRNSIPPATPTAVGHSHSLQIPTPGAARAGMFADPHRDAERDALLPSPTSEKTTPCCASCTVM